jgi:hypothetical protein
MFSYFSNNSESNKPDKPAETVKARSISAGASVVKDDTNSSPAAPSTTAEEGPTVPATGAVSQPVTTAKSQQRAQQLQQTPVSPHAQQVAVCNRK